MIKPDNYFLSIVIPVYNEKLRIHNIEKIASFFNKQRFKSEIIIIDDGSNDNTLSQTKKFAKKYSIKIISYKPNYGKGYAVRKGMLTARGTHRIFIDIDLSTPIEEYKNLLSKSKKSQVVIASRRKKNSKVIIKQSKLRESMGHYFTRLSQTVLGVQVSDFTCGFKYFHKDAAEKIFSKSKIDRWGFDSEILFLAKKYGYSISEIPVTWKHNPYTKVKFPQDIINSLIELFAIRINNIRGIYG